MKKLLLFMFIASYCSFTGEAQNVSVNGTLQLVDPVQKVYLSYRNGAERVLDSADIKGGKFMFSGTLTDPTLATLTVSFEPKRSGDRVPSDRLQVFIEAGKINIVAKDSLKFAKVFGSKAQKEYDAYKKLLIPYDQQEATMGPRFNKFREAGDEEGMKSIQQEYQIMAKKRDEQVVKPYILAHPASPIVISLLNQYAGSEINVSEVEPLYEGLSATNRNSYLGKSLKGRIEIAKKTAIGAKAMNFTQNDTLGKPVSLSDFEGKYVLVDFWASWCGPCRAENPNVVKAFNQYKDKNFTVLGVSLDRSGMRDAWLNAIHKDGLAWTQVSDLQFWNNAVAKQYGIRAIPQNLLIDPSGIIIAKNIRGEELVKKLAEVLN